MSPITPDQWQEVSPYLDEVLELHPEERAADVSGDAEVELVRVDVGERGRQRARTGVVERRVETAEHRHGLVHHITHRRHVGDVGAHGERPAAAGLDTVGDGPERGGVAGREHHGGPGGGERLGGGRADALAGPRDQGHPSVHGLCLLVHDIQSYEV